MKTGTLAPSNAPDCCASFEVWPDGKREWAKTINARSAGLKLNVHPQDVVLIRHNVPALAQSGGEKTTTKKSDV
jgi:hypothetical protein